jgi:hypothetical protein
LGCCWTATEHFPPSSAAKHSHSAKPKPKLITPRTMFRLASIYIKDLKAFPEIAPVTLIVAAAVTGCSAFMSWKMFNTPDVTYNPAKPYNFQTYAGHNCTSNCRLCAYNTASKHTYTY